MLSINKDCEDCVNVTLVIPCNIRWLMVMVKSLLTLKQEKLNSTDLKFLLSPSSPGDPVTYTIWGLPTSVQLHCEETSLIE